MAITTALDICMKNDMQISDTVFSRISQYIASGGEILIALLIILFCWFSVIWLIFIMPCTEGWRVFQTRMPDHTSTRSRIFACILRSAFLLDWMNSKSSSHTYPLTPVPHPCVRPRNVSVHTNVQQWAAITFTSETNNLPIVCMVFSAIHHKFISFIPPRRQYYFSLIFDGFIFHF